MNAHLPILVLTFSGILFLAPPARAQQTALEKSQSHYLQGMAAEKAGDPVAAKAAYEAALKAYPRNANARYRLGQVEMNSERIAVIGRKNKLNTVVIPEFKIEEASLKEALAALSLLAERESKGTVQPNFIVQDSSGTVNDAKVSLVLKSTPAGAILNYLLEQANAKARFDEHAIVLTPR